MHPGPGREGIQWWLAGKVGDGRVVRGEAGTSAAGADDHWAFEALGAVDRRTADSTGREDDRLEDHKAAEQSRLPVRSHQQAGTTHRVAERVDRLAGLLDDPGGHRDRVVAVPIPIDVASRSWCVAVTAIVERCRVKRRGQIVGQWDVAATVEAGGVRDE